MKSTICRLIICTLLVAACTAPNKEDTPETPDVQILCVTGEATSISENSAILNGMATIQNASVSNAQAWFYYSSEAADAQTLQSTGSKVSAGQLANTGGDFSCNLSDLYPSSTYYYVASASIDGQEVTGKVKIFTTEKAPNAVAVTGEATDISETRATLYGVANLSSDMVESAEFGVEYSATDLTREATTVKATERDENGKFIVNLTGLKYNTKYFYRTFVLYNGVREYGEVSTFSTVDFIFTVTTEDASAITEFTATLNGKVQINSIDELSKSVYFLYSSSASDLESLKSIGTKISSNTVFDDGTFNYGLTLNDNTTYYCVAYVEVLGKTEYGEVISFTTKEFVVAAVDLGLSVKWATCNLGATRPYEYGEYYQWAGTSDVADTSIYLDWDNCPYHTGSDEYSGWTKYNTESYWGIVDNKTTLETSNDAATVNLGGKWRMPTDAEWTELRTYCTWTWTTLNGINGYMVASKTNGNSIFLPAAGHRVGGGLGSVGSNGFYWSSSLVTDYPSSAYNVDFYSDNGRRGYYYRYYGHSVRPVSE